MPLPPIERALARLSFPSPLRGEGQGEGRVIDVVFVDDRTIAALAGRYRKSPRSTDVLAFGYEGGTPAGEIAISLDTAARQARERGVPLTHELTLLCVHGLLHLQGQGDETYRDWCGMRRREFETMMRIL